MSQEEDRYSVRKESKDIILGKDGDLDRINRGDPGIMERIGVGKIIGYPIYHLKLKPSFFEPRPKDSKPIADPGEYGLPNHTDHLHFDRKKELSLWLSEPTDPQKGYVIYFEGMAGHWGDLGIPDLIVQHNKLNPDNPSHDGDKRDYRLDRITELQKRGYGVVAVHLPGYGASTGKPGEKQFKAAVDTLIPWLQKSVPGLYLNNSIIMGASQGCLSAAYMAKQLNKKNIKPQLLALVSPPLSTADCIMDAEVVPNKLKNMLLRNQESLIDFPLYLPELLKNAPTDTPAIFIAGKDDWVVPGHHVQNAAHISSQDRPSALHTVDGEHATVSAKDIADRIEQALKGLPHSPIDKASGNFGASADRSSPSR